MRIEADWLDSQAARAVLEAYSKAGKTAYFVGGCVRNALLGVPVADFDISTDALPDETIEIAQTAGLKTVPTGIDHGTVTVIALGTPFEVTTFRRDVETDGRRAVVAFSSDVADDARRRDFTMNALYADGLGEVIDPLGGLGDLLARRVRFIEDADRRIAEDYLRILRFFRFHAWYGDPAQGLDAAGLAACAAGIGGIDSLSKERIGAEMRKLLAAPDPAPAVAAMDHCGALTRVLPGANVAALAPLVHLESVTGLAPDWQRRLASLGGADQTEHLRLSKAEARRLAEVLRLIAQATGPAEAGYRFGKEVAQDAALILAASTTTPMAGDALEAIERGAAAQFPVRAEDLQPQFSGKALGDRLKQLEARWIASGFVAGRAELLD